VLHYGQYKREQLFEAARRSRPCAYLTDDDYGPLALREILLVGCLTVSVRTGAPFIPHRITSVFIDRLPPGAKCVKNDADEAALAAHQRAIHRSQSLSRARVRSEAATRFAPGWIVNSLTLSLKQVRERRSNLAKGSDRVDFESQYNLPSAV
jgi:hypothetical protein